MLFDSSFYSKKPEKKNSSTLDNNKCFLSYKLFLKDHVKLKTGVMAAEKSPVPEEQIKMNSS